MWFVLCFENMANQNRVPLVYGEIAPVAFSEPKGGPWDLREFTDESGVVHSLRW